jgi:hypothetical protein
MKKQSKKLSLNRETLIPLTDDILDGVNGGFSPVVSSSAACVQSAVNVTRNVVNVTKTFVPQLPPVTRPVVGR